MAKPDISRKRYFHCYKITCSINGKGYIGIASNGVKTRFNQHKHDAKKGASTPLHAAIRKYGVENFTIEVLGKTTNWDEICLIEREMILKYDTLTQNGRGYNVSTGGEGPFGVKRSTETKEKLSEITKKWLAEDPDRIQNLIEAGRKQMADPARREQIRKGARDAWKRPDFREKFSSGKKKWANENRDLLSEQQKRIMARPEMRENLRKKAKAQMKDPSNREISKQGALQQWQNDEFKKKMTLQMKAVSKRNWENPDYRQRMKNISCKPIVAPI
jgi:group I intron endonuclease